MILKLVGTERNLSTANTVDSARLVRVYNNTASTVVITRADSDAVVVGNTTMQSNTSSIFEKETTDTLAASGAVLATPLAYSIS